MSLRQTPGRKGSAAPAETAPFATVTDAGGQRLLAAVNPAAAAAGLAPDMPLADALSFVPALATAAAEPAKDAAALRRLAEWCGRYSPWTAPDATDGIKIEITGCAHLWGGEEPLAADLIARLTRQGIAARIAIAESLGAAWACARFTEPGARMLILPSAATRIALAPLPVAALRLDPATAQGLRRVGLKRIGDLYAMPRDALARRFGVAVAQRLDQALGDLPEPLSPLSETPARRVRLSFAEPIADPADLALATERLADDLATRLAREGAGARRLALDFHRVEGRVERIALGTARPSRDPHHLAALLKERLDTIDPGLGVEDMILAVFAIDPLRPEQLGFAGASPSAGSTGGGGVATLLDRLGNRFGLAAVSRLEARESHLPERASIKVSVSEPAASPVSRRDQGWRGNDGAKPPRPIRLFEPPEPIEAAWLLPDDPPFRFTWRRRAHRVRCADGPERIAAEWWRPDGSAVTPGKGLPHAHVEGANVEGANVEGANAIRDYYRVEDDEGRRFWLFRAGLPDDGQPLRWFVHGVFA
ncbi:MAG TPA: DNA polymerase Y family protein [Stellaceae bacterium]|nr:DNA polymerase Y family protein [Stellaceae bacterium]